MKSRVRTLQRLRSARERLRDVSAASYHLAEEERLATAARHSEIEQLLAQMIAGARGRIELSAASGTLLQIDGERLRGQLGLDDAAANVAAATVESARRREVMCAKERDLRVAEKLLERARELLAQAQHKSEQRLADDLAAIRQRLDLRPVAPPLLSSAILSAAGFVSRKDA